jgi:hypothetical protein
MCCRRPGSWQFAMAADPENSEYPALANRNHYARDLTMQWGTRGKE